MAIIPRRLLKLRDDALSEGENVLWQGRPDAWADLRMLRVAWCVGAPWLALVGLATWMGWIAQAAFPLFMVGVAISALPLIRFFRDQRTLFVITDRRALILRAPWGEKPTSASTSYNQMNKGLEILTVSGNVGHLYFASDISTRSEDADYTGRYGFRCVKDVAKVRDLLAAAIARYA